MKKLLFALAALMTAGPAAAADEPLAPAVKRKPAASVAPPQPSARPASEREYQVALGAAAGQDGSDTALETSLIRVMSRLLAAGRCGEAASLAARDGRKELASRAQQLCK